MKNIGHYILLLFAAVVFTSCEKVIDFEPDVINPYVVLISQPESDSLVTVYLSRSRFFLDNSWEVPYISDAKVSLHVGDVTYDGTYIDGSDRGYYLFGVRPQPGDSLYVEAMVPGEEGTVSAGTRIPTLPTVELVDYSLEYDEEMMYNNYSLTFKLKGGRGREYYSISIRNCEPINMGEDRVVWDTVNGYLNNMFFSCDDAILNNTDISSVIEMDDGSFYGNMLNVSNEFFKDGEHVFTLEFTDYYYGLSTSELARMPVWLIVKSISPELYRYNQTVQEQDNSDGLLAEPVQVMCNINGGIGIFGGVSRKNMRLPVAEVRESK